MYCHTFWHLRWSQESCRVVLFHFEVEVRRGRVEEEGAVSLLPFLPSA